MVFIPFCQKKEECPLTLKKNPKIAYFKLSWSFDVPVTLNFDCLHLGHFYSWVPPWISLIFREHPVVRRHSADIISMSLYSCIAWQEIFRFILLTESLLKITFLYISDNLLSSMLCVTLCTKTGHVSQFGHKSLCHVWC